MRPVVPRNIRIIDVNAIRENMKALRQNTPTTAKMMAVVKADAYGHGAFITAKAVLESGADMLAVATVGEGCELRELGIDAPILVLGAVTQGDVRMGVDYGLIQTVCTPEMVCFCEQAGKEKRKQAEVHLSVDTGMGRIGVRSREEMDRVLETIQLSQHVHLTGVFTHFSDADGDEDGVSYTRKQFKRFCELTDGLPENVIRHCDNSAAIHRMPDMAMNMVRAGISLYGYPPVNADILLQPCMEWRCKVSFVKDCPEGTYISYGRTFRTVKPMRIATVTCGYGDGYHRNASGKAEVLIRGQRFRVIGRICMDQMMVDITGNDDIQPEDPVILMGKCGEEAIGADDIAGWSGTISYEILLSAGSRVERQYTGGRP
jgi:alanine racemase